MAIPNRGLRNIKTLSGRVGQDPPPYRGFMQVTCLEMERARRNAERRSASQRIASIDARLAEIDAEKAVILQSMAERRPTFPAGGFRIRY